MLWVVVTCLGADVNDLLDVFPEVVILLLLQPPRHVLPELARLLKQPQNEWPASDNSWTEAALEEKKSREQKENIFERPNTGKTMASWPARRIPGWGPGTCTRRSPRSWRGGTQTSPAAASGCGGCAPRQCAARGRRVGREKMRGQRGEAEGLRPRRLPTPWSPSPDSLFQMPPRSLSVPRDFICCSAAVSNVARRTIRNGRSGSAHGNLGTRTTFYTPARCSWCFF